MEENLYYQRYMSYFQTIPILPSLLQYSYSLQNLITDHSARLDEVGIKIQLSERHQSNLSNFQVIVNLILQVERIKHSPILIRKNNDDKQSHAKCPCYRKTLHLHQGATECLSEQTSIYLTEISIRFTWISYN